MLYYVSESIANLGRQVRALPAGASQKELDDMKKQMEKDRNNLTFANFTLRNVSACDFQSFCMLCGVDITLMMADVIREGCLLQCKSLRIWISWDKNCKWCCDGICKCSASDALPRLSLRAKKFLLDGQNYHCFEIDHLEVLAVSFLSLNWQQQMLVVQWVGTVNWWLAVRTKMLHWCSHRNLNTVHCQILRCRTVTDLIN